MVSIRNQAILWPLCRQQCRASAPNGQSRLNVDVIAASGGPPTAAARKATTTIPIVAALVADPVAIGSAATLARPGGNVTGITNHDPLRATRQLTILKEVFPKLARVAFLSDADIPGADASGFAPLERDNIAVAAALNIRPQTLKLRGPTPDLAVALDSVVSEKADVLLVMEVPVTILTRGPPNSRRPVAFQRCFGAEPRTRAS